MEVSTFASVLSGSRCGHTCSYWQGRKHWQRELSKRDKKKEKKKRKRKRKRREKKRETADRSFLLTFHHHRQTLKFHEVLKVDEVLSWIRASWRTNSQLTMVENGKKHRQNSHPIIHCPTSEGVSEVSERANE